MIKKMDIYETELMKELVERKRKEQEIGSNPNYINWLQKFTTIYPRFTDNDFLYKRKKRTPEDIEGVANLSLLYKVIEKYADKNYIYPIKNSEYSGSYRIKYNNIGYEIGVMIGNGTIFFCKRIEEPDETFIDYEDILLNKKQSHTDEIENKLMKLGIIIHSYYKQGIPLLAITEKVNLVLTNITKSEKKQDEKILRK